MHTKGILLDNPAEKVAFFDKEKEEVIFIIKPFGE